MEQTYDDTFAYAPSEGGWNSDTDDVESQHCIQSLEREYQQVREHIKLLVHKKAKLQREINKHKNSSNTEICDSERWREVAARYLYARNNDSSCGLESVQSFPLFNLLPVEVILHVFTYLSASELCRSIVYTCSLFYTIAQDESLWAPLYYKQWGDHKVSDVLHKSNRFGKMNWRSLFTRQSHTESNWWRGHYTVDTFEGHKGAVRCMQFAGDTLVTGSADKTIKVWDLKDGRCTETLHDTKWVRCLRYDLPSSTLVTTGMDSTQVKVWNLTTNSVAHVLEVQRGWVTCLQLDMPRLVTGSLDGTIRVWDAAACNDLPYAVVRSSHDSLRSVCLRGDLIMSAGVERHLQMWDIRTKATTPVLVIEGAAHGNYCVQFDMYSHIVASGSNGLVALGDTRAAKNPPTLLKGHADVISCLQFSGRKLVTGSMDQTIRVWDLLTHHCATTLHGHESWVWDIQFDHDRIFTGSGDKTVKLWAFNV